MLDTLTDKLGGVFRGLSGRGTHLRGEHPRGDARGPHGAARGRRQLQGRQGVHRRRSSKRPSGRRSSRASSPAQLMVKIVYDELVNLMGPVDTRIYFVQPGPTVIMMCGLQGSGKTTTCGKLAMYLVGQGPSPDAGRGGPAAAGGRRAAARARRAGGRAGLHRSDQGRRARAGRQAARRWRSAGRRSPRRRRPGRDVVILDTAGRLAHRRRADGRAEGDQHAAQPAPDLPRARRDDRPGRRQLRQGVQRAARARRPDPHEVRLRHPRRRAARPPRWSPASR